MRLLAVIAASLWLAASCWASELEQELLKIRRIHVERLTGGEMAAHLRDMIITSLHRSGLFLLTENPDRADAFIKGSAEDLIFTGSYSSSEGLNARATVSSGSSSTSSRTGRQYAGISVGDQESKRTAERKHEAVASVRLTNKDGDVIWSTTQESLGGKFRGASADVADKITRQLVEDYNRIKYKVKPQPPRP